MTMRRVTMAVFLLWTCPALAQIRSVTLQPPARDFGYFVGDRFASTAVIVTMPDTVLDKRSLPSPGPVATALDITSVDESETDAAGRRQITIRVTYESFVAPEEVAQATVPGYELAFAHAGTTINAGVPAFAFSASTFRHDLQPVLDKAVLRPDPPVTRVATDGPKLELFAGAAGACLALLGVAITGGWARYLSRGGTPFAAARRVIARLGHDAETTANRDALLALHRAFDLTAGARIMADDVESFVAKHPRFLSLHNDIENFFSASRLFFFGAAAQPATLQALKRLSRDLARAERR